MTEPEPVIPPPRLPVLFLLFNHRLTPPQEADARAVLGVTRIVALPREIQVIWGQVPPEADEISSLLAPARDWLAAQAAPGDFVLIQGDFGATCLMVNAAIRQGLIPVYSTTRRQAVEERMEDGSVHLRHIFTHVRFRRYGL